MTHAGGSTAACRPGSSRTGRTEPGLIAWLPWCGPPVVAPAPTTVKVTARPSQVAWSRPCRAPGGTSSRARPKAPGSSGTAVTQADACRPSSTASATSSRHQVPRRMSSRLRSGAASVVSRRATRRCRSADGVWSGSLGRRRSSTCRPSWTAVQAPASISRPPAGRTTAMAAARNSGGSAVARLSTYVGWASSPRTVERSGRPIRAAWTAGNRVRTVARVCRSTLPVPLTMRTPVTSTSRPALMRLMSRAVSSTVESATAISRSRRASTVRARCADPSTIVARRWTTPGVAVLTASRRRSRSGSPEPASQACRRVCVGAATLRSGGVTTSSRCVRRSRRRTANARVARSSSPSAGTR